MGGGATVIQGIEIGEWTVLGAGSVVNRDVPPNVTAVGMPAKPIKERLRAGTSTLRERCSHLDVGAGPRRVR